MKHEMVVKLSWDSDAGDCWMNIDNLKSCLFSPIHTKPELLGVDIEVERSAPKPCPLCGGWLDSDGVAHY